MWPTLRSHFLAQHSEWIDQTVNWHTTARAVGKCQHTCTAPNTARSNANKFDEESPLRSIN